MGLYNVGRTICFFLLVVSTQAADVPGRGAIDAAMVDLSAITDFKVKHPVAFESITRDQVNQFLKDRIKDGIKPDEIRAEEVTLKKFGFVPSDFDLKKTTIELLTEQTAAFYDFHKKKLFITDWAATVMQDEALVHELAHALADQNFNLGKYSDKVQDDSEKSLARQAVVEGQASWLMRAVLTKRGAPAEPDGVPAKEEEKFPVFDKAPLYFQVTLMFPYDEGEIFQQAVFAKYGKEGFTRVFQHPPVSAQQIMHPDLYFSGLTPLDPDLPNMDSLRGMKRYVEGPVGELDHLILLSQFVGEQAAKQVSPHWRGGRYRIYENKKDKHDVLVYRSVWNSDESARQFFDLYEKVLRGKWKTMDVTARTDKRIDGTGDDGYFCVDLNATLVTSREGLAAKCN